MTRAEILQTAEQMVTGSRQEDYGEPEDNFERIGQLWEAYTGIEYSAEDVAIMMALLKIGRIASGKYNKDNYIDLAGYAACAGEIADEKSRTLKIGEGAASGTVSCLSLQKEDR